MGRPSPSITPDAGNIAVGWTLDITTLAPICCDLPDLKILSIERLGNGNIALTGSGVPNQSHTMQLSTDPTFTVTDPTGDGARKRSRVAGISGFKRNAVTLPSVHPSVAGGIGERPLCRKPRLATV